MGIAATNHLIAGQLQLHRVPAGMTVLGLSILLGIFAGPEFLMMTVAGACLTWLIENELTRLRVR